jgi:long-subunit fatty acid transport protein
VTDYAPSLGYALNDKWSFGAGLDVERASTEYGYVITASSTANDYYLYFQPLATSSRIFFLQTIKVSLNSKLNSREREFILTDLC